ncbi:uncharacterized protein [Procambarus clarkii]|uniref:uncharacterized protein isoform X1 n=1 Tax=Procambarus clarkii TaxID=6728 RepID=UPI001E67610D|nr:uncharacterized protein LOC123765094 isoform X1 [Procambarus clarkii]
MRLFARSKMVVVRTVAAAAALVVMAGGAPVPAPPTEDNLVEIHEEGLMVLVPTLPIASAEKNGNSLKREVEYEIITIPKELLKREIRQISQLYGAPSDSSEGSPTFIVDDGSLGSYGDEIIPSPAPLPTVSYGAPQITVTKSIASLPAKPAITLPLPDISVSANLGQVLAGASSLAGGVTQTLTTVGKGASQVLAQVVPAAAAGGVQAARWLAENKAEGVRAATQGLQYAGQLSAAVLRVLLQVPSIKARVLSEVIRASQPLTYAISDVLAESADDFGDIFEAKNDILKDALEIFIRLIQDTLALKGRIIAKLGASGLDVGATAFNAGVRVGGAFVETAGGIATALGTGVGDLVRVATTANFPAPPPITLPQLPSLPKIILPTLDLSVLAPQATLAPLPLPSKPATAPVSIKSLYNPPTEIKLPSQLYGAPGR